LTLIISCITQARVVQVSDRRLTYVMGPNSGQLADDERNKVLLVDGTLAMSYTGLAEVGNQPTDDWLLDAVSQIGPAPLSQLYSELGRRAAHDLSLQNVEARHKRFAIAIAGWSRRSTQSALHPFVATTSNAMGERLRWLPEAQPHFRSWHQVLRRDQSFILQPIGQPISSDTLRELTINIRKAVRRNAGPLAIIQCLAKAIRTVARDNPSVGSSLMAIALPRPTEGAPSGVSIPLSRDVMSNPSVAQEALALYLPPGDLEGVQYVPHLICGTTDLKHGRIDIINPRELTVTLDLRRRE